MTSALIVQRLLWLFLLPVPTAPIPLASPTTVTLAARGEVKATVVIAPDATRGVQQAAAELSHYAARIADCPSPLPVKAFSKPPKVLAGLKSYVFVGNVDWALSQTKFDANQLPEEGYSIFAHNASWLFIVGKNDTEPNEGQLLLGGNGPVGSNDTLAAVYGLLGHLGVAWLWPGELGEVIPSLPVVSVPPGGADISSAPPLIQRHLRPIYHPSGLSAWKAPSGNVAADTALTRWMNDSVYRQLSREESLWLQRMRMGGHRVPPWGQAFMTWWQQYNHTHPEYFALQPDGHRGPVVASEPDRVKMCVSNSALHKAIAAGGTDHNVYGLSAAEDDSNTGYCTCSKCTAWDAAGIIPWNKPGASTTGSLSDRYAKFFDAVYAELAKTAPDAWVTAYAYEQYRDPPVNYTISGNVMMGYVGFGYPALPAELADDKAHWAGWFAAGAKRLFWRPNCLIAGDGMPYMFGSAIANDFKWLGQHGLAATDFDSLMGHWSSAGPTYYSTARMHWLPKHTDPAEILTEYYSGFGAANAVVKQYVEYWTDWTHNTFTSNATRTRIENLTRAISKQAGESHGWYKNIAYVYLRDTFDRADALLEKARQACKSLHTIEIAASTCVQRVDFLSLGCTHGRLVAEGINATNEAGQNIPGRGLNRTGLAIILQAATKLTAFRAKIAQSGAVNVMWAQYNEVKLGDYTSVALAADILRTTPDDYQPLLLTPSTYWIFALDEKNVGVTQKWYNASWRAVGNWSRIGTMDGWSGASALRAWNSAHPGEQFSGAGWFRHTFSGEDLEKENELARSNSTFALAVSAACGSLTGWINGAPLKVPTDPVTPGAPLLLEIPAGAVHTSGPNIVALRFQDRPTGGRSMACADSDGAGLRGRVIVVGSKDD